ncbi:hypothetical protein ACMD2_15040 [Ananas comosus]|uniref:Uncharacterized protein n=1 Tax=Ananas comosus TaxID=4615 RepID=A0A199W461_ANACO|nr:hypothetical protein ACMD2_15040 [Ananas comosus]
MSMTILRWLRMNCLKSFLCRTRPISCPTASISVNSSSSSSSVFSSSSASSVSSSSISSSSFSDCFPLFHRFLLLGGIVLLLEGIGDVRCLQFRFLVIRRRIGDLRTMLFRFAMGALEEKAGAVGEKERVRKREKGRVRTYEIFIQTFFRWCHFSTVGVAGATRRCGWGSWSHYPMRLGPLPRYAVASLQNQVLSSNGTQKIYGAKATINLWQPHVEASTEFS